MACVSVPLVFIIIVILDFCSAIPFTADKCGTVKSRQGKIVGGTEALQGEYPWIVSFKTKAYGHFCSGFLISSRHILSAAHCFVPAGNKLLDYSNGEVNMNSFSTVIGEFNQKEHEHPIDAMEFRVIKIVVNPQYNANNKENDIAILTLAADVNVHSETEPICIPRRRDFYQQFVRREGSIAGWGLLHHRQSYNNWKESVTVMRKAEVTIWDVHKCKEIYRNFNFPSKAFICAGDAKTDSCQGDSGGPLMVRKDNQWTAIGIVSAGKDCGHGGKPGVYTDVSSFLKWIEMETA